MAFQPIPYGTTLTCGGDCKSYTPGNRIEGVEVKRDERRVYSYDLISVARAQHAQPPTMTQLIHALQVMYNRGEAFHVREKGSVTYRIGDINIDQADQTARILLRRCDTNAANAVYSHKDTGVPRILAKNVDEGGDKAAHIVVSLTAETRKPNHYLCHLEGVPGIGHRLVQAAFNAILKDAIKDGHASFSYPDPGGARVRGGQPKTTPFVPNFEMTGHPSPALVQDLEHGRLSTITLVDTTPTGQFGGNRYLIEKEKKIELSVSPHLPQQGRIASVMQALQSRKADFSKAVIRFTDPAGLNRSVEYDIDTGSPDQEAYIASYFVTGINPPMDESSVRLAAYLTDAMNARVVADRT